MAIIFYELANILSGLTIIFPNLTIIYVSEGIFFVAIIFGDLTIILSGLAIILLLFDYYPIFQEAIFFEWLLFSLS